MIPVCFSEHQKPDSRCAGVNSDALDEIEAVLLQLLEPRLNKQGPKWGDVSEEYFQYVKLEFGAAESADPELQVIHVKLDLIQQQILSLSEA